MPTVYLLDEFRSAQAGKQYKLHSDFISNLLYVCKRGLTQTGWKENAQSLTDSSSEDHVICTSLHCGEAKSIIFVPAKPKQFLGIN